MLLYLLVSNWSVQANGKNHAQNLQKEKIDLDIELPPQIIKIIVSV